MLFNYNFKFSTRIRSNNLIILPNTLPKHTEDGLQYILYFKFFISNINRGEVKNTIQFKNQLKLQTLFLLKHQLASFVQRAIWSNCNAPWDSKYIPSARSHHVAQDSWKESAWDSAHFHRGLAYSISTLRNIFKKNFKS